MQQPLDDKYSNNYSEKSLWEKFKKFSKKAGKKVIYCALLLYYVLQKPEVPVKVRLTIIGALGYFITPIDAIPDIIPMVGFTDDFGALGVALTTAAMYVDDDVKQKAKNKLRDWFGNYDDSELEEVNNKID